MRRLPNQKAQEPSTPSEGKGTAPDEDAAMPPLDSEDVPTPAMTVKQAKLQVTTFETLLGMSTVDPRLHDMLAQAKVQLEMEKIN